MDFMRIGAALVAHFFVACIRSGSEYRICMSSKAVFSTAFSSDLNVVDDSLNT